MGLCLDDPNYVIEQDVDEVVIRETPTLCPPFLLIPPTPEPQCPSPRQRCRP